MRRGRVGSRIGAGKRPGWIELHRMASRCCAHQSATVLVWLRTAALDQP